MEEETTTGILSHPVHSWEGDTGARELLLPEGSFHQSWPCEGARGVGSHPRGVEGLGRSVIERAWQIQWLLLAGEMTGPRKIGS